MSDMAWGSYDREYWDAESDDRLGPDRPSRSDLAYDAQLDDEEGS